MNPETTHLDPSAPDGLMAGQVLAPRRGERAAKIRYLADKYPDLSNSAIARRVGCAPSNVTGVLKAYLKEITPEDLEDFRSNKAAIFESIQHRTLSSITDSDIAKTPFMARITAAAILQDKIQVMRGQPTAIHVHALVDVLDALRSREGEE